MGQLTSMIGGTAMYAREEEEEKDRKCPIRNFLTSIRSRPLTLPGMRILLFNANSDLD